MNEYLHCHDCGTTGWGAYPPGPGDYCTFCGSTKIPDVVDPVEHPGDHRFLIETCEPGPVWVFTVPSGAIRLEYEYGIPVRGVINLPKTP